MISEGEKIIIGGLAQFPIINRKKKKTETQK